MTQETTTTGLVSEIAQWLGVWFRLSIPIMLAALGGYLSECSGIFMIALEGFMLLGAFSSAAAAYHFAFPLAGIFAAIASGVLWGSLFWWLTVKRKAEPIVAGLAINTLGLGLPGFLCKAWYGAASSTPALDQSLTLYHSPGFSTLGTLTIIIGICLHIVHYKTKAGLFLRFAGAKPQALWAQGVQPERVQAVAVVLCGILASFGGAYLSIEHGTGFTRGMTAGRGFMALAAVIAGRWRPLPALGFALFFDDIETIQIPLQSLRWGEQAAIPLQLVQVIPYALTLGLLIVRTLGKRTNRIN